MSSFDSSISSPTSYSTKTNGILIEVYPSFNEEHSNLENSIYVYVYKIRITNQSSQTVQLISRHWTIRDGFNNVEQVVGEGVIGQQPVLRSGESFEYSSFCPLRTPSGSMEGSYQMKTEENSIFEATVGKFDLRSAMLMN